MGKLFFGRKRFVDEKGQRRKASLVCADRKPTVTTTKKNSVYHCGEQKSISEPTIHQALRWLCYNSRRSHQVLLLSAKTRTWRLQWAQTHSLPGTNNHAVFFLHDVTHYASATWLAVWITDWIYRCSDVPIKMFNAYIYIVNTHPHIHILVSVSILTCRD